VRDLRKQINKGRILFKTIHKDRKMKKNTYILIMNSIFGKEKFTYTSEKERTKGLKRILLKIKSLKDGVNRSFKFLEK
jgi:hypothetical protein